MFRGPAHPEQFRVQVGRFGDRHYFDPLPDDDRWPMMDPDDDPFPSVSTIKKVTSRDFSQVSARRVAEFAVTQKPAWIELPDDAAIELLVGADRRGLNRAAERGTAVHGVMEDLAAGRTSMLHIDKSAEPYIEGCKAFLHDLNPEFLYVEVVALSRSLRYGGTLDAVLQIAGKLYLVDWKSRKAGSHGAYEEEAWQIAAYAKADYWIVEAEGGGAKRIEPPELDGGLIVSLCPGDESYRVYPVDLDRAFDGFHRMRLMWDAKHLPQFKPLGRPVELAPRSYVPPATVDEPLAGQGAGSASSSGSAPIPAPATKWDPFGEAEAEAPTPEPELIAFPFDLVGQWVTVRWVEVIEGAGQHREAEQVASGWLQDLDDRRMFVRLADDNGNATLIPIARQPKVEAAEHPAPVGVAPIANAVEGAVVQPPQAETPRVPLAEPRTGMVSDGGGDGDPEIRAWLRRRLEADVAALGGQTAVLKYWPAGVKSIDAAGNNVHSKADLAAVERALDNLERDLQLPFPEPKPQPVVAEEPKVERPLPPPLPKPAHLDDLAVMVERVKKVMADYPLTFKAIQDRAEEVGVPNLRTGRPTDADLLQLDTIISEEIAEMEGRRTDLKVLEEVVKPMAWMAMVFAVGIVRGEESLEEPSKDLHQRMMLLHSAIGSVALVEDGEAHVLEVTDGTLTKLHQVFGDDKSVLAKVNPYLVQYGFDSIKKVDRLRRAPLGVMLALHDAQS